MTTTQYRADAETLDAAPRLDRLVPSDGRVRTGVPDVPSASTDEQGRTDEQGTLAPLGLDAATEDLYRLMLAHPDDDLAALSRRQLLGEAEVRRMLGRLGELSLVRPSDSTGSGFRPVPLEIAMDLLIAQRQARLAADLATIEQCRAAAARFVAKCSAQESEHGQTDSTRLVGEDAIRERLAYLSNNARTEVMRFAPGGPSGDADPTACREPNEQLVRRGVRIRTVYQDSIRDQPSTWAYANWLCGIGGEVRVAEMLPTPMIIFDRRQAVVPVDPGDLRAGAMLVWGSAVVAVLTALFEPIWTDAVPIGSTAGAVDGRLSSQERTVLRLLAAGLTDEAVAKRIGCSPRTARRIAAQLMEDLDAQSRFQAGVHAVAKGWLKLG